MYYARRARIRLHFFAYVRLVAALAALIGIQASPGAQVTSINLSTDLASRGLTNLLPNRPDIDARPIWNAAMAYVAGQPAITSITVTPGAYYFQSLEASAHALVSLNNKTVDLQGSELRFTHRAGFGLYVYGSANTVFRNFSVDYATLPFTQVTITDVNPVSRVINYTLRPGWPSPQIFNGDTATLSQHIPLVVFRSGKPVEHLTYMTTQLPFGPNNVTIPDAGVPSQSSSVLSRIAPGDTGVIVNRVAAGTPINCNTCDRVTFENIRIYSGGGAMMLFRTRNSLVKRVYVMPKPGTDRLISMTWGGISLDQAQHNNTFLLSRVIRAMDDGFDPHALIWGTVSAVVNSKTLRITLQSPWYVLENDDVEFLQTSDSARVGVARITGWTGSGVVDVQFDRDVSQIPEGAAMAPTNPVHRGSNTLIDRSAVMHVAFANGITLWGLVDSTVRRSYVQNADHSGINLVHWLQPNIGWLTPPASNISIENNVIDGTITRIGTTSGIHTRWAGIQALAIGTGSQFGGNAFMTSAPFHGISIRDNFIADPSRSALRMQSVNGGAIQNNLLVNPNNRPHPDGWDLDDVEPYKTQMETPIVTSSLIGVTNSGNVIQQAARLLVTDTQFQHLAAYAPGSRVVLHAPGVGGLPAPAVSMRDATGMMRPVTVVASDAHRLEVTLPNPAATDITGGAYIAVQSGGTTLYGTLFVDTQDNVPALNGCVAFTNPKSVRIGFAGGTGRLVVVGPGCAYSATSSQGFVTITGSATTAPGAVTFAVTPNFGAARTAIISVAGDSIEITQDGIGTGGPFTDDPLIPRSTMIRALHVIELRVRIDAVRQRFGLAPFGYSRVPTAGVAAIAALDILEMRTALAEAYARANRQGPAYTTSPVTGAPVVTTDIAELRAAVRAIE